MADDFKPPGKRKKGITIPRERVDRLMAQRARQDRKGQPVELSVEEIYNSKAEGREDKFTTRSSKWKLGYKDLIDEFANVHNLTGSELDRRAHFVVMRNPALLASVDDLEEEYKSILGSSRHHEIDPEIT